MSIEALTSGEVTKVAMSIAYALDSLQKNDIDVAMDDLNFALWYIGTTVEELDNMNENEVWS